MPDKEFEIISSLPVENLVAAPVVSAARAQIKLCQEFAEFIRTVGMDKNGNLRTLPLKFQAPTTGTDGKLTGSSKTYQINAPFMALTGVPNFAIEELDVEFNIKVETMEQTDMEGSAPTTAAISGRVAQGSKQTRKSDTSAQYNFKLAAKKQPPSEAVMKILDILTQATIKVAENE